MNVIYQLIDPISPCLSPQLFFSCFVNNGHFIIVICTRKLLNIWIFEWAASKLFCWVVCKWAISWAKQSICAVLRVIMDHQVGSHLPKEVNCTWVFKHGLPSVEADRLLWKEKFWSCWPVNRHHPLHEGHCQVSRSRNVLDHGGIGDLPCHPCEQAGSYAGPAGRVVALQQVQHCSQYEGVVGGEHEGWVGHIYCAPSRSSPAIRQSKVIGVDCHANIVVTINNFCHTRSQRRSSS